MTRPARRLLAAVLVLAALDVFVPGIRDRLEAARYDGDGHFRFENSDLFGIGPLTAYLRDHPNGPRPRVVFLGNSVIFGYHLTVAEAPPAQYQRLVPDRKVFNAAINGLTLGSAHLIAKAMLDGVDTVFVLSASQASALPALAGLIPISEDDARRFELALPSRLHSRLDAAAGVWRLNRDAYRLQAALFGTSTRQFVYLNKGKFARAIRDAALGRAPAPLAALPDPVSSDAAIVSVPMGATGGAARDHGLITEMAALFRARNKRLILIQLDHYSPLVIDEEIGAFNAQHYPFARIVKVTVPAAETMDTLHLTPRAIASLAAGLARLPDTIAPR